MRPIALFFVLILACVGVCAQESAQESARERRVQPLPNLLRVGIAPGWMTSKVQTVRGTYDSEGALSLTADYEHLFSDNMGFAINLSQNHFHDASFNVFYAGASILGVVTTNRGWRWEASAGMGYGAADADLMGSRSGMGFFSSSGVTYKLSRHWGIGADLRWLTVYFRKPKGWEGAFGTKHIGLNCGLSYLF